MEEEVFKKCIIIADKLESYGFTRSDDFYIYKKNILDNSLEIIITIKDSIVKGKVIDKELEDEYLGYRVEKQVGDFANKVKEEFIKTLQDIKEKCAIENNYISPQANRICNYIKEKYGDSPEFLWDDNLNSVFRNKNNKKWYGIIMYINKNKLTTEDKMVEVMNVKLSPKKIDNLLNKKGYYKAYHMNKKYWISFILDDSTKDKEIIENIEESYNYTIETNEWVIPANTKYFDVIEYFSKNRIIKWHQSLNMNTGDSVYIYLGQPYSCIKYKCIITNKDINSLHDNKVKLMELEVIKEYSTDKYPFEMLKQYDLKAIRGARRIPIKLLNKMKEDEVND